MPVRLLYDRSLESKISFSYSPTVEMMLSLHVLCNAKHHAVHLQWAVQTKRQMDRRMIADLRYFGTGFRQYLILCDLIIPEPGSDLKAFDDEAEELAGLSDLDFAHRILRECCDRHEVQRAMRGGKALERLLERFQEEPPTNLGNARPGSVAFCPATARRQAVRDLLCDPSAFRARLMDFLRRYWQEFFAPEFDRLEPRFLADITEKAHLLRASGAFSLLTRLFDQVVAGGEGSELVIYKQMDATIDSSRLQSVTITPTCFAVPHLILTIEPERFQIWYDLLSAGRRRQPEIPPARLISLLRAMGDEVRLSILKLVAQKRRSTQELAQILNITPPSVSRHLRILKEAGLLTSQGEGYYVFYSLVPEQVLALGQHLTDFVELRHTQSQAISPSLPPDFLTQ